MCDVEEGRYGFLKCKLHLACRTVTVLGNIKIGLIGRIVLFRLIILRILGITIQKHDDIGILLDGSGFTKVGQHRMLVGTGFHGTRQL